MNERVLTRPRIVPCLNVVVCLCGIQVRARDAITRASEYMTGLFDESEEFCNYALALSTFSLLREPSGRVLPVVTRMVAELKTRIVTSKICESLT